MNEKILSEIKQILTLRNCSNKTIANYISIINRFLKYHKNKNIKDFKEQDIINYLKINFLDKKSSPSNYNVNLAAIKYFYLICFNKRFHSYLLPQSKITKTLPKLINKNIIIKMIKEESNLKYKAFLSLGYGSGLRISEVATLKIENILSKDNKILITGKGKKERFVPLPDFTLDILRNYCIENKITSKTGFLFPCVYKNKDHVHTESIRRFFKDIKDKYNLPNYITFHCLRHTFATEFMKNNGDILVLKKILGHVYLNSTSIYTHTSEDFSKVFNPLDGNI